MHELTDAQMSQLVQELEINSPIRSVSIDGDIVTLRTAWDTFAAPVPSPGRDDTLPRAAAGRMEASEPGSHDQLDDFTAIDGVGPVTASRLHNAGFYTYDDLRASLDVLTDVDRIQAATVKRIAAWLARHPF